ncbi:MAG TPA: GNAT family N-acetyltransferase [Cyanobacteria bacterium UBA11372]|nr:GNAT family N-acetyltransferase [Cyanobacteria bacterium UBA11372]
MLTLTMRPYGGEKDLEAIAHLLNACAAFELRDDWTSVSELRLEFEDPLIDKQQDIRLWEDADGKLIGFAQMWIPPSGDNDDGFVWFNVHPEFGGDYLEKQAIAWGEQRMRQVAALRGVCARLRVRSRDDNRLRMALLESCGFTPDRYFLRMERSLVEPLGEPKFPEGFTLRQLQGEQESEPWVEMFNQTFIDHWNYHPLTVETHKHWFTDPNYKPEFDLVAIAPDGMFAAFCFCYINPEENEHFARKEGWIADLGTRRGFRKIGLGRAMLLAGLHQLKASGMETAKLGVDADNPNGALQLYQSVGFRKLHTNISYYKDL